MILLFSADLSTFQRQHMLESRNESNNFTFMNFFTSIKNIINIKSNEGEGQISRSLRIPFTFKTLHSYFKPLEFYEDNKIRRLQETTKFLYNCQLAVASYTFSRNDLARSYLLKARYKEDKENFYISLNIEPPIFYDKFPNKKY